MKAIKEIMSNAGLDINNPEGLEGTSFYRALNSYKEDYNELESLDDEEKQEALENLQAKEQKLIELFNDTVEIEDDPDYLELQKKEQEAAKRAKDAEEEAAYQRSLAAAEAEERAKEKEELERKRAAAEARAKEREAQLAEAEARAKEREEKLAAIEEKEKLRNDEKLYLLNNKRALDYSELAKLGIDADAQPRRFEWNGYVFEKRWMFKEYVILRRPALKK